MEYSLFRADQRLYLRVRIQFHSIPTLIPGGKTLAKFGDAHVRLVAVSVGIMRIAAQCFDGLLVGGHIGTSDTQTDDVLTFRIHLCYLFQFLGEVVFTYACQSVGRNDLIHLTFLLHIRLMF